MPSHQQILIYNFLIFKKLNKQLDIMDKKSLFKYALILIIMKLLTVTVIFIPNAFSQGKISKNKKAIINSIEEKKEKLIEISDNIWEAAETSLEEFKSSKTSPEEIIKLKPIEEKAHNNNNIIQEGNDYKRDQEAKKNLNDQFARELQIDLNDKNAFIKHLFDGNQIVYQQTIKEIESLIKEALPDAKIEIQDLAGDGNHYSATVISSQFAGKSKIQQHKMVYNSLKGKMGNELHALAIKTKEN